MFKSDDDLGYAVLPLAGLRGGEEVDLSLRVDGALGGGVRRG